jgi:hypothetical protein
MKVRKSMKKLMLVIGIAFGVVLFTGCEAVDLSPEIKAVEVSVTSLEEDLVALETIVDNMNTELEQKEMAISVLEDENAALLESIKTMNSRIKNALNRDEWATRKIGYNADYSSYEAEYCFGIFDLDWSLEADGDYKYNEGLKFVITIEEITWGTEAFVKDSCGNYSEFIYENSSYSLYSIPTDYFEVGKTYEVILYKDVYFSVAQLGLLPLFEMGDFGSYPTDLSGIVATELN